MATASVPYSFVPLEDILSSEANANFAALVAFLNTQVIHKDGTVASTGTLSGPAADPVSDNQYARKAYVDNRGPTCKQLENDANITLTTSFQNLLAGSLSLEAGTWKLEAFVTTASSIIGYQAHTVRIQNTTDATTVQTREGTVHDTTSFGRTSLSLAKVVTIASTKTFEVQGLTSAVSGTQFKDMGVFIATKATLV